MKFAREGLPFVIPLGLATFVANLLGFWWVGFCMLILTLAVAAFFRDPERDIPIGEDRVLSPADGRVVAVDAEAHAETLPGEAFQRVGIFMSPLNVHVNRAPVAGEVLSVRHTPGRFLAAFTTSVLRSRTSATRWCCAMNADECSCSFRSLACSRGASSAACVRGNGWSGVLASA